MGRSGEFFCILGVFFAIAFFFHLKSGVQVKTPDMGGHSTVRSTPCKQPHLWLHPKMVALSTPQLNVMAEATAVPTAVPEPWQGRGLGKAMKGASVGKHGESQHSPEAATKGQGYERKAEQEGNAWNNK